MEESSRRWEDLDTHILKKIFSFSDSPGNILRVCHSWRLCCFDILFWEHNVLDLSPLVAAPGKVDSFSGRSFRLRRLIPKNVSSMAGFKHIDNKLMKLLESILYGKDVFGISLEHWRLSIRSLFIPKDLEISNQHLLYIAERTPRLESLTVLGTSRITSGGFANAVCNWKHVKHIILGHITSSQCFTYILEEIGRVCRELRTLNVRGRLRFQASTAYDVSKNLPDVERQKFEVAFLIRKVMNLFLSNCPKLEKILFDDCFIDYDFTDLLEWSRLSFAIKFDQREKTGGGILQLEIKALNRALNLIYWTSLNYGWMNNRHGWNFIRGLYLHKLASFPARRAPASVEKANKLSLVQPSNFTKERDKETIT
ncbi:uncharacterized protein LOC116138437 [Pistacia vera]|uniref:uncharacterized protein LOC116138437 n=1 Tax=Pistacia vera TaxID=55513 RepID=UPI001262E3FE|nr:uncharacterized protein LOC116138437 [Pistacia vera]